MQAIGIKRLEKAENECGKEINKVLFHVHPSSTGYLDGLRELQAVAEASGIPRGDFATLVAAKKDAQKRITTDDPVPLAEVMAEQLGLTVNQYFDWLDCQAKIFDGIEIINEDDFRQLPRQKKMPLQTLAPWEEEEALLEDLQQDAELWGD